MKTKNNKNKTETEHLAVFCEDGSFSSGAFAVLDVSRFKPHDWAEIEDTCDRDRWEVAQAIAKIRNFK